MSVVLDQLRELEIRETKLAYYSLLQYEPDSMRNERLNIAVLLESPNYQYRGARFLRNMHKRVREFDPTLSEQVVYRFAKHLEHTFTAGPARGDLRPIDFSGAPAPEGILGLILDANRSLHTLWRFTEPRAIVVDATADFEQELAKLYRRLVQAKGVDVDDIGKDKAYVRRATVNAFEERKVQLVLDPEPVKGAFFLENEFDAVYQREFATFVQFLSFDTSAPTLDQAKAYITARNDVGDTLANVPVEYLAVVQPPELARNAENRTAYDRCLHYFSQVGINHIQADKAGYDLAAYGLQGDHTTFKAAFANA